MGSEMCIRDRLARFRPVHESPVPLWNHQGHLPLLFRRLGWGRRWRCGLGAGLGACRARDPLAFLPKHFPSLPAHVPPLVPGKFLHPRYRAYNMMLRMMIAGISDPAPVMERKWNPPWLLTVGESLTCRLTDTGFRISSRLERVARHASVDVVYHHISDITQIK